jgi:hypothetical protein
MMDREVKQAVYRGDDAASVDLKIAAEAAVAAWLATIAPESRARALEMACNRFRWQMQYGAPTRVKAP